MRKIIILFLLLLPSFFTNAAYYMELGDQMRITFSDDLQTAVVVNQKDNLTFRYQLFYRKSDQIDNGGAPYTFLDYKDNRCVEKDKCEYDNMMVSVYTDKIGGARVSLIDKNNKINWQTYITQEKLTKD